MKLTIEYSNNSISNQKLDALIVFIFEDAGLTGSGLNSLPNVIKNNLNTSLKLKVFSGKKDTCQQLLSGYENIPQILAVGVGKKNEFNSEKLRCAAGTAGKILTSMKVKLFGFAITSHLQNKSEIISLHLPLSVSTKKMINKNFINQMKNPFWLINTARGNVIETDDVVEALKSKKIIGVALDVLEYESSSFESIFKKNNESLDYLIKAKNVILSPHIAGWTYESHKKLSKIILNKLTKII